MRVVKAFGPGDLRVVEAPTPIPRKGEVLVAVKASGICGSDKWYWSVPGPTDSVAGHEVAGQVAAIGEGVQRLQVGDRVAVNNVVGCGSCPECREGRFVRCPHWDGTRDVNHGLSEYIVAPEANCMRLHDSISYEAGCLIFDNWGTPYGGVERAGVNADDEVLVSGCGPIGLCAVVHAKIRGARVIAVDPLPYRREAAIAMGADAAVAPDDDIAARIKQLSSPNGPSVVLECSGSGKAYLTGLSALRVGGTFVAIGEHAHFDFHPSDHLIRKHLNLLGSWYTTMEQGREVQAMMVEGKITNPTAFVTHRVTLDEVPEVFGKVCTCSDNILKAVVLL